MNLNFIGITCLSAAYIFKRNPMIPYWYVAVALVGCYAVYIKSIYLYCMNAKVESLNPKTQPKRRSGNPDHTVIKRLERRHWGADVLQRRYLFQSFKHLSAAGGHYR
jgi:hypothetical protein